MADWLKAFRVGKSGTIIAINEMPAGGDVPAIRFEARCGQIRTEETFTFASQAEADAEFARIDSRGAFVWVEQIARQLVEGRKHA